MNESARGVAADLRAIAELLGTREADDALLDETHARLAELRAALDAAPARPRWYDVDPSDREASRAFHDEFGPMRGAASVVALPLVFAPTRDGRVVARARGGVLHEGPPRLVHGGIVAACFDEVLAVAQRDAGVHGLTTELTVRYRRPITIDTDLTFTAWIESDDGRRATGRAECTVHEDVAADATATFVRPRGATAGS